MMQLNSTRFAGTDLSSGRKPVLLTALDEDLNITILDRCDVPTALSSLREYEYIYLGVTLSSKAGQTPYLDLKEQLAQAGFKKKDHVKQWFETSAQDCYRQWMGQNPLPRRTLEGRFQRALVLYERGVRMADPMEIFEEVTRYKLIRGTFRLENIYSSRELDALAAAYLAWMSLNRPGRTVPQGELVLPAAG